MPSFVRLLYQNPSPTRCKKKLLNQSRYFLFFILIFLFSGPVFASPISNADRKILSAAINGNIRLAKKALKQGASVHAKDPLERNLGETPLHKVAFNNDVEFLRFLLSEGANTNLSDERGETPLITAVYGLGLESVSALLGAKADPYLETKSGINPAVLAADLCSLPLLQILKNAGVDLNRPTKKGFLPIHTAAGRCNGKFLKFLIESGADPQTPTKTGTTPLMQAIKLGNLDAIHFLLEQNVSVSSVDRYGHDSMFYLLARKNYTHLRSWDVYLKNNGRRKDIILGLIQKGASLYREYEDGITPLFLILTMDDEYLEKFFFDYFKNHQIDLNVPNRFGVTPFQYCWMNRELELLSYKQHDDEIRKEFKDVVPLHTPPQYCRINQELELFSYKQEGNEIKNRINRFLLERNAENPTFAFYYVYLLNVHFPFDGIQNTTLRKIYSSLLDLPKLPDLKNLELGLWTQIFATKDPDLKKKLLSRFQDPPAGFWSWIRFQDDYNPNFPDYHPDADPELSDLWVRSIQKGDTVNLFDFSYYNEKIHARHGIYHALKTCNWNLLDQLSSRTSLWKFVDPDEFWKNYWPHCVTGEKEEATVYRLFQSTPSEKIVSPLCNEIEILEMFSDEEKNEESRKQIHLFWGRQVEVAKEIEQSRKRILNFVKMGAKPSCRFESSRHWLTLSKALETVRKYKLKDLEKIILSFDAKDPQKIQKAIAAGDRSKIQNLLEQGAIIGVEELKLAQKNPRLLSYLLEEYNSLDSSPVFDTIDHFKEQGTELLSLLIQKGFSLKVLSKEQYGFQGRRDCAIAGILLSDFHPLQSLLRPELFAGYSCRGGFDLAFHQWLHPSISNSWSQEKIKTKIKALQLESVFPDLWEESYFFEPE
ncbi:ankyrin repeat domain-containing protein [Leptospira santarosai]|uniref:ankyrin repeat domain-containing protein n=1 Tax=Leptospira santarosai TaxID=28183 RepID=UPI0024AEC465|nr:ankyrin repeat domain-containing protein [Leptospira santarosai]MDI7228536.1 ankyrin repeat domain-containing protein [Leptospira santarosai]